MNKSAISFNILLVLLILYLRNIYIFRSQITSAYIYNQCSSMLLLMVRRYKQQYTDKTLTFLKIYVYMRASGASALRKFSHFYILKQSLLLLSIYCRYFRYFIGTNDMLVGLHACTDKFPNVPTKLRKNIIGGGGQLPLATLMFAPLTVVSK